MQALFFAESTLAHDSSSHPGRVILKWRSHIFNGLVSGGQVNARNLQAAVADICENRLLPRARFACLILILIKRGG